MQLHPGSSGTLPCRISGSAKGKQPGAITDEQVHNGIQNRPKAHVSGELQGKGEKYSVFSALLKIFVSLVQLLEVFMSSGFWFVFFKGVDHSLIEG